MASLAEFFEDLRDNPRKYLRAERGNEFEDRIQTEMDRQVAMPRIHNDQIPRDTFRDIKQRILRKTATSSAENTTEFQKHYIFQPYGSQQYPDLLIFDGDRLHAVEIKFSKKIKTSPVWNSGPPRPTGIYIFGAYGRSDLTFFMGQNVLPPAEAEEMHRHLDQVQAEVEKWNHEHVHQQRYGFRVYARRAFDQKKTSNPDAIIDFFTNPDRKELEDEVITYLREVSHT